MCGIVGYAGAKECAELLLDGLRRLEYRGYDSSGLAVCEPGGLHVLRRAGKVAELVAAVARTPMPGRCGIGHTRWATHGKATEANAHPHCDCYREIAVVHNGIIENHGALRTTLQKEGHRFLSETDSEVLPHLIERFYKPGVPLEQAVAQALKEVHGTYGIAVVSSREGQKIVAARKGSPLVVALGKGENLVASDVHAVLRMRKGVVYLKDDELAVLTPDHARVFNQSMVEVTPEVERLAVDLRLAEKAGYAHYMLKEIHEQPEAVENTMRGRVSADGGLPSLGGLREMERELRKVQRVVVTACGTSWHAGLVGKYLIEELAGVPVEVDYASEFRYRNPLVDRNSLVIVISQSGETADTLAALREAKTKGAPTIGICNVPGSSLARETDAGVFTHAGPEIGVASTKAFTCQITVLAMLAVLLGRYRRLSLSQGAEYLAALQAVPDLLREALESEAHVRQVAAKYASARNFLYLGRGYNYPVALEGALKLKEISYIHAEGYPAAEMKHGPIALVDEHMPVVVIAPRDQTHAKILSNIQELHARNARIIAVCTRGDEEIAAHADMAIELPPVPDYLAPLLTVVPLQLLAYHIAVLNGRDVDQPRNLAKSVTVE